MMKKILIGFFVFGLFLPYFCQAAVLGDVVINEIAWMGAATSASDEWIELKNTTDATIDVSGWKLISSDGKLKISLKNAIPAQGFYLLERTDDNSVPEIKADTIYSGALGNTGEDLILYDKSDIIIDQINFASKWPAGNNDKKQTMERTSANNWQTSLNANGTPKIENGPAAPKPVPKPTAKPKTALPKTTKTANNKVASISQASIAEKALSSTEEFSSRSPLILFLIVLAIIIIASTAILIFKYKTHVRS